MTPKQVEQFATDKLKEHGLWAQGWSFRWNTRKRAMGICDHRNKTVEVSAPLFRALKPAMQEEEVKDTVLHEIAHALTPGAKHGWRWQQMARKIGAKPYRCQQVGALDYAKVVAQSKYVATCTKCGNQYGFNRYGAVWQRGGYCCGKCKGEFVVTQQY